MDAIFSLAYIDPGSGTVLLQILLSGFFAGLLFFRNTVLSLFGVRFRRGKRAAEDGTADEAPEESAGEEPAPHEDTGHDRVHVTR